MKKFAALYSALYGDNCHPFNALCDAQAVPVKSGDDMKESNSALIVWGGSDIHPAYYKHQMHPTTYPGGQRDKAEWSLMQAAIEKGIAIIGVCRGAQMGCAAAGGWLIQNVYGHAGHGGHSITTKDGTTFTANSIHHQMMAGLDKVEHELVAWSTERRSETFSKDRTYPPYGIQNDEAFTPPEGWVEPEFVYFPKINCYAIQWHPEGMSKDSAATQYVLDYITKKENERAGNRNPLACVKC